MTIISILFLFVIGSNPVDKEHDSVLPVKREFRSVCSVTYYVIRYKDYYRGVLSVSVLILG